MARPICVIRARAEWVTRTSSASRTAALFSLQLPLLAKLLLVLVMALVRMVLLVVVPPSWRRRTRQSGGSQGVMKR